MPSGELGRWSTAILAAEWQDFLGKIWNSERPLVFTHVVITKMLGVCGSRDIMAQVTRRMELWERGLHTGLVRYAELERATREGRDAIGVEE